MIWAIFAAMALGALAVPLLSLIRSDKRGSAVDGRGPALAVYDDQLQEIETEIDRGKLAPELGDEMRTEIKRRMVALADLGPERIEDQDTVQGPAGFSVAVIIGIVAIIGLAMSLYLWLGRPDLSTFSRSGSPIATATPELDATDTATDAIEAGEPEDAAGWFALGRQLWLAGNPGDAANAYGRAIRLAPDNAEFLASQGGALIDAMGGQVSPSARFVLTKAMLIDPDHPLPRFYLGLGLFQDGNFRGALTAWQELEARSQAGSPWLPNLRLQIARAEEMLGEVPTSKSTAPRITPENRAAVDAMSADEQAEFINAMVARLEARLEVSPVDLDGWLRLARTYIVLGRDADAARALETALALAPEADRARIEADFADSLTNR